MSDTRAGFEAFAAVAGWKLDGPSLEIRLLTSSGRTAGLIARAISPETWKLSILRPGAPAARPSGMVIGPEEGPQKIEVRESRGRLTASGPELDLEVRLAPFGLRFNNRAGRTVLSDNAGDVDGLGRPAIPVLGTFAGPGRTASVTAGFHLRPGERLYGLGEKFTRLDKSGLRLVSWISDALGSTSQRSHKSVPFLWSSRGFGLFLDTGARITWDLGAASLQSWTIDAETRAVDAFVFHGPRPERILAAFTALTGRPPAVPKWSYGLWLSSGGTYRDQASIEALIDGAEKRRLPFDVVHIDPWWMRGRRYCDFRWNRRAFPDPGRLIDRIHRLGLKLCLWEHPYVSVESGLFDFGKERGYFVRRPDGGTYVIDYGLSLAPRPDGRVRLAAGRETWNAPAAIIDLTNPPARAWFQDLHRPLLRAGVDVFKTDFGEDVPEDARFHDGRTGAEMHNLYPLLYNAAVFEVTAEEKGRGLVWSRAGTAGSQRYPVGWSGDPASDFDSLAATIRGGLSAGMSGIALWSHDIGGYRGNPDRELFVRWAQFGLFSSHSRMHGDSPREPWRFGPGAFRIVRKYAALRYALFPYLFSAALEAAEAGLPVIRALPLAFPDDANAPAWDHEYLFGPSFLVAPVIRRLADLDRPKNRSRRPPDWPVYLPPGEWVDYWTGRRSKGPRVIKVAAPLDVLPLFVKAGAVIPMAGTARRIPAGPVDPLWLDVHPGRSSTTTFIEDEGRTPYRLERQGQGWVLEWSGPFPRRLRVGFRPGPEARAALFETGKRRFRLPAGEFRRTPVSRAWIAVPRARAGRIRLGAD